MVVYENSLNRLDKEDWRQTSEDHAAVQSWCHARDLHSIVLMFDVVKKVYDDLDTFSA